MGVEEPRKQDLKIFEENQLHEKDYWFQKKILGLPVINIAIDTSRISKLVLESDSRATPGIINSIFSTRKNYSQKWEVFGKKFQHLAMSGCKRLRVNGYLLEASVM
ncbi:hypothetical protein [Synechocystis sp. LKSZ1]|uniref:hypothetical protein n=1 Tax=Synechocystis sp. LKSZ1 TaxID=3144951 RepID=UPI00336BD535